jgi:hypothetical protein
MLEEISLVKQGVAIKGGGNFIKGIGKTLSFIIGIGLTLKVIIQ